MNEWQVMYERLGTSISEQISNVQAHGVCIHHYVCEVRIKEGAAALELGPCAGVSRCAVYVGTVWDRRRQPCPASESVQVRITVHLAPDVIPETGTS